MSDEQVNPAHLAELDKFLDRLIKKHSSIRLDGKDPEAQVDGKDPETLYEQEKNNTVSIVIADKDSIIVRVGADATMLTKEYLKYVVEKIRQHNKVIKWVSDICSDNETSQLFKKCSANGDILHISLPPDYNDYLEKFLDEMPRVQFRYVVVHDPGYETNTTINTLKFIKQIVKTKVYRAQLVYVNSYYEDIDQFEDLE